MDDLVRDDYLSLDELRLHYREWGDITAPPLVLLHGFTGHARSWDSFARAMSRRYRVLALDQRGHGESGWTTDYSTPAMVGDLRAFVRALCLEHFDLLGLSMGGSVAYHYAGSRPPELDRLVIVDIGPELVASGSQRIQSGVQAADTFDSVEAAIAGGRAGNARADEDEMRHRVRHNLMRTVDGRWTFRYDKALRSPGRPRPRPSSAENWAAWKQINVPTLLLRGGVSDILALETAERMAKEIPDCRLIEIPGSGHSIPLEAPVRFLEAVQTFL
ncbi:MAG: alpha/beta fold hydrolase [Tepidiformaceae bacterium]